MKFIIIYLTCLSLVVFAGMNSESDLGDKISSGILKLRKNNTTNTALAASSNSDSINYGRYNRYDRSLGKLSPPPPVILMDREGVDDLVSTEETNKIADQAFLQLLNKMPRERECKKAHELLSSRYKRSQKEKFKNIEIVEMWVNYVRKKHCPQLFHTMKSIKEFKLRKQ